jgi:hypothetical protein
MLSACFGELGALRRIQSKHAHSSAIYYKRFEKSMEIAVTAGSGLLVAF